MRRSPRRRNRSDHENDPNPPRAKLRRSEPPPPLSASTHAINGAALTPVAELCDSGLSLQPLDRAGHKHCLHVLEFSLDLPVQVPAGFTPEFLRIKSSHGARHTHLVLHPIVLNGRETTRFRTENEHVIVDSPRKQIIFVESK